MAGTDPIYRRVNRNTVAADIAAAVGASTTFNAGDFITFNGTTKTFGSLVGESDSVNFAGVAVCSVKNGVVASAYSTDSDAALGFASIPGPEFGDEVFATLKAGDAVVPGSALYYNTGATPKNGVTITAGTKIIGYYWGPALTGAPTSGTIIPIKLGCRLINSGLLIG